MKIAVTNEKEPFGLTVESGTYSPSYETLSGSIVTFSDAWVGSKIYPNASIVPVQSLNGQDKPYPPGGGKNKTTATTSGNTTSQGINFEWDGNNIKASSTASATNGQAAFEVNNIDLTANTQYTLSFTGTGNNQVKAVWLQYTGSTETQLDYYGATRKTFTVASAKTLRRIIVRVLYASGDTANINMNWQLEEGSSATSYTPYSNICPITGFSSVDVSRCGKNLFNWSPFYSYANKARCTASQADDGTVTVSVTQTGAVWVGDNTSVGNTISASAFKIRAKKGDVFASSYSVSTNVGTTLYEVDAKGVRLSESGMCPYTVTNDACAWVVVRFAFGTKTSGDEFTFKPQIELGSEPTDYVPYNGITKTISLGSTIYGGILNVDSGVLTVDRAMVDLGTLEWNSTNTGIAGKNRFYANIQDAVASDTAHSNSLCSQYSLLVAGGTYPATDNGYTIAETSAIPMSIFVFDSQYASSIATAFKTAMNGVQLCYTLATPTTIQLTGEEITALLGENNVWANSGDVEVTYRKGGA